MVTSSYSCNFRLTELGDGEMIHGENFNLFAAMSALEVLLFYIILLLIFDIIFYMNAFFVDFFSYCLCLVSAMVEYMISAMFILCDVE